FDILIDNGCYESLLAIRCDGIEDSGVTICFADRKSGILLPLILEPLSLFQPLLFGTVFRVICFVQTVDEFRMFSEQFYGIGLGWLGLSWWFIGWLPCHGKSICQCPVMGIL